MNIAFCEYVVDMYIDILNFKTNAPHPLPTEPPPVSLPIPNFHPGAYLGGFCVLRRFFCVCVGGGGGL